jgi:hypothetical protein
MKMLPKTNSATQSAASNRRGKWGICNSVRGNPMCAAAKAFVL